MVGVVGSSPIAPTNDSKTDSDTTDAAPSQRAGERKGRAKAEPGYGTANAGNSHRLKQPLAGRIRPAVRWKARRSRAFFVSTLRTSPCRTSDSPTAPSAPTIIRSPSPTSPRRSARAWPRPRSAAGVGRRRRAEARRHVGRDRPRRRPRRSSPTKDADGLDVIRHSTAHLLAYAVKELFPDAQVTIGPVIDNGFYYDFSYKRPFTPEDLAAIEKRDGRDREAATSRSRARCCRATRRSTYLQVDRRGLQGRDHRRDPRRPGRLAVPRGRLRRPVPRPARAVAPAS